MANQHDLRTDHVVYQLFFGKAPDWRAHIEGQLALFLARGPESFVSGQAHQLYVDGRILIVRALPDFSTGLTELTMK